MQLGSRFFSLPVFLVDEILYRHIIRFDYGILSGYGNGLSTLQVPSKHLWLVETTNRKRMSSSSTRRALALGLAAAGFAVVAGAAIAVYFSVGNPPAPALPPQDAAATVLVTPQKSASLVSPDGRMRVDLTEGSVAFPVEFSYRRISPVGIPLLPAGFVATSKVFDLSMSAQEAPLAVDFAFVKPVTLTIQLSAQDIALAGGMESNVLIHHAACWVMTTRTR